MTEADHSGPLLVSQDRVLRAMQFWEAEHIRRNGPLDHVSLPLAVSKLADLLGVMWYENESQASLLATSSVGILILEAERRNGA